MIFLCWSRRDARVPFLFRLERFALFLPFLSLSIILCLFFFLPLFFLQEVSANRYGHNVQCGLRPVSRTNRRRRKPFTRRASPAMMSTRLHGILVLFCLFFFVFRVSREPDDSPLGACDGSLSTLMPCFEMGGTLLGWFAR